MTVSELELRMRDWLVGEYAAVLFVERDIVVAYALFTETEEQIYLRQLFVVRDQRRHGIGRAAVQILRTEIWPASKRLIVEVLVQNNAAVQFWRAVGFRDYSLTLEIMP